MFGKVSAALSSAGRHVKHGLSTGLSKVMETKNLLGDVYGKVKNTWGKIAPFVTPMLMDYAPGASAAISQGFAMGDMIKDKADDIVGKAGQIGKEAGLIPNPSM